VSRAVDDPVDGLPLLELAGGRRSAVVVVPDATRRAALPGVLPAIVNRLLVAGIEPRAISVLVACGTHPPVRETELGELVGELPAGVSLRQHGCRDDAALATIGELRPGLPLRLDRAVAETELLLTVGAVRHHYFAGFGGGPKMVFPGVGGHDEIQANHALVIDRSASVARRHPGCEPGRLAGNPVAEEIARAADLRPPDMAVCLVLGRDEGVAFAAAGPWRPAWAAAVERARAWYELEPTLFRRLVACAGGRPGDATLIQAHKWLDAVCRFAEPGAEILFAAELGEGPGSPAMAPFLGDPRPEAILERLSASWVQYGHTTLRIVEKTAAHRVHLKSALDPDLARRLGFEPIDDLDEIPQRWRDLETDGRVAVMAGSPLWPRRA
jgi:nickel-dependent lactate racemase